MAGLLTGFAGGDKSVKFRDITVLELDPAQYLWVWRAGVFEDLGVGQYFRFVDDPDTIHQVGSKPLPVEPRGNYQCRVRRSWKYDDFWKACQPSGE